MVFAEDQVSSLLLYGMLYYCECVEKDKCMMMKKSRFSWGGVVLLVCGLCALAGLFAVQGQSASAATPAFVRVIHASPFVGTADVFVDGAPLLTSFGFGQVTPYVAVPAGQHKVQIALAGKGINASALIETLPPVQAGVAYTVAALGTDGNHLSLAVFVDNNYAVAGTARVRVYQLAPDGGSMHVMEGGDSMVAGVSYQNASNYFTMTPGSHTFDLGSAAGSKSLSTTLNANTVTSIFVVGVFSPNSFPDEPRAELVQATTAALPGLPQTGSNPFAFLSDGRLSTPWLLIAIAMTFVGGTLFTRRLFGAR